LSAERMLSLPLPTIAGIRMVSQCGIAQATRTGWPTHFVQMLMNHLLWSVASARGWWQHH